MTAIDALGKRESGRVGSDADAFAWVPGTTTPNPA